MPPGAPATSYSTPTATSVSALTTRSGWDYASEGSTRDRFTGGPSVPEGALEEHDVPRPLTLLVRNGHAVGGQLIEE